MKTQNKYASRKIKTTIALALLALTGSADYSLAAGTKPVEFNETVRQGGITMSLNGVGAKSVVFVKAFVAGFYSADVKDFNDLGDYPKHLEVEYFVNITAQKLNKYTLERMKRNATDAQFQSLKQEIEAMQGLFVDLKPGDRFSLTYLPQSGTKFSYNGREIGFIKGKDFAKVLFAVWIGEAPIDRRLKEQILGIELTDAQKNNFSIVKNGKGAQHAF